MAPLKLAIVGCGAIADYLHLPTAALTDEVEVCAAVDIDRARANALAAKYSLRVASRLHEVAEHVDAAIIAVPPHLKVPIVSEALDLGLHALCEKPLANTVSECEEMGRRAAAAGRVLGVVHQFRFWPSRQWIQRRLGSGELPPPLRVEVNQGGPYSWQSQTGYTVRQDLVAGGVLINAGTHPLDTLISWFGDPMDLEYHDDALGGLESNVRMRMGFERVEGVFRLSRTCRLANEMRLVYDDRQLIVNNSDPFRVMERRPGVADREVVVTQPPAIGYLAPAREVYRNFAAAVVGAAELAVDAAEGTRVIRLVERCYAMKRARPVPVEAPLPGLTW